MKKTKGLVNHMKEDKIYEPVSSNFTLEALTEMVKELHAKRKPGQEYHLINRLGAFRIVDGFWYIQLSDDSYVHCESPYDKDLKLKEKVVIIKDNPHDSKRNS